NRTHGLIGGRWRSRRHGAVEQRTQRETKGTEPIHLPAHAKPAAYLTRQPAQRARGPKPALAARTSAQ
ncbi:MAG TPA: hypothetical protein VE569_02235, partial [Acidimicrobiia bacterium]|nr:hypothetical protein [Acidimicrobiia bacterium]